MALCLSNVDGEIKELVYPSFKSAIRSLEQFVDVLGKEAVDSVTTLEEVDKVASKLRPHVTKAYTDFSIAHKKAAEVNARIAGEVEASVAQQQKIQSDIHGNEAEETSLSNRVDSIRNNVRDYENQVIDARSNLSAAESTLSCARDKLSSREKEQKAVAITGVAISIIPFFGWIAGPVMVIVSLTALEDAVKAADSAVDSARDNVRTSESRLQNKKEELHRLENELSSKKSQREENQRELKQRQKELENLKETQKRVLDMSLKLKYLTTLIATTRGRTKVLRDEFEIIYSLDALQGPLRAIAAHFQLETFKNNRLISGEMDLSTLGKKFQVVCDKTSIGMITNFENFV